MTAPMGVYSGPRPRFASVWVDHAGIWHAVVDAGAGEQQRARRALDGSLPLDGSLSIVRRGYVSGTLADRVEYVATHDYEQSLTDVWSAAARLAALVDAGTYPRALLDAYVDAARARDDWHEPRYVCKQCGAESPVGIGYVQTMPEPLPAPAAWCRNPHVWGGRP